MTPLTLRCLLAGLLATAACGGGPGEPSQDRTGLRATAGANATDTIGAVLTQALVMRLGDSRGNPVAGAVVRFESLRSLTPAGYTYSSTSLSPLDRPQFSTFQADTTDAAGNTSMIVALGTVAGAAGVIVSVPSLGLVDTVAYTVTPGAPARLAWSVKDTALLAGGQYTARASVTDRYGNARSDTPTYSGNQFIASVDAAGKVTVGTTIGRGIVRASFGAFRDSATVTVVPPGRLVVLRSGEVGLVNMDGSGYVRVITAAGANNPAVNRAGTQVAYHEYTSTGYQQIIVVDVATGARRMLLDPTVIISAVHPRYSADGTYIYFAARRTLDVQPGIWRARTDGSGLEEVVPPGSASYSFPDPSPDGREVAFTDLYSGRVVVKTLATGALRTMAISGTYPRFSPDGTALAAIYGAINTIGVDGSGARSYSVVGLVEGGLTWCPSSACLVSRSYNGLALTMRASGETLDPGVNRDKYQVSF